MTEKKPAGRPTGRPKTGSKGSAKAYRRGEGLNTGKVGNVVVIEFPEVNEDVVRVDNAAGEEPVKQEEQEAKEEVLKEDREQRAAAIASRTKLLCE